MPCHANAPQLKGHSGPTPTHSLFYTRKRHVCFSVEKVDRTPSYMPASSAAISHTTSFLNEVFAQRGSECPYEPQFQGVIRQHLLDLVGDIPSLTVKQQPYTHYDGRSARLLVAEGTVPMYYQGVKYNIPVALWLPERYPFYPPLMYVTPTSDMVIRPRHPFVDPSGLVGSPYLHNWAYPSSNLRELAQDASILFSGDPPLYSKPPGWTPPQPTPSSRPAYPGQQQQQQPPSQPTQRPHSPPAFHNPLHGAPGGPFGTTSSGSFSGPSGSAGSFTGGPSSSSASFSGAGGYPPSYGGGGTSWGEALAAGMGQMGLGLPPQLLPYGQPPPPLGSGPPAQLAQAQQGSAGPAKPPTPPPSVGAAGGPAGLGGGSAAADDASRELRDAFRQAALAALSRRLAASAAAANAGAAAEVERLAGVQAELARREAHLQQEVAALQSERVALDQAAQSLGSAATQLDRWLANNGKALAVVDAARAAAAAGGGAAAVDLDPDSVIVAADPLSQQALEVQAQDLALEDTLYALDKALNAGLVQPDAYIKQVRGVCRQQFLARALGNKIAAKQQSEARQAAAAPAPGPPQPAGGSFRGQHAPPPPPPPLHGVQMPQGDSWYSTGILPNPLTAAQQ